MSDDFENIWMYTGEKQRGLTVKEVFHLSNRGVAGFVRSLAETTMFRLKTIFGDSLSARLLETQTTQALVRCAALNRMAHLCMPQSYKVA
jgi:hypothetical protein